MSGHKDDLAFARLQGRTAANERIAHFIISMNKFMDEVGKILDETKTDAFADYGDPIHSIEDIGNLFESYKVYLKKFEKSA